MPNALERQRVAFPARADDDDHNALARLSTSADLRDRQLRAVMFPPGGVGALTALVRDAEKSADNQPVRYVEAVGFSLDLAIGADTDAGSWIVVEKDWPLMDTVFVLDTARDEAFELILVVEIRG